MALFSRKPRTPTHPVVPVAVQSTSAAAGESRLVEIGTNSSPPPAATKPACSPPRSIPTP